ncbi:MAG: PaaI family thioesterase [Chloroflexi bacterium]|nr:PaaI family thioesterase [Chloroflexota bacterium]
MTDDNYCFACGKENPIGLKLEFELIDDNDGIVTEFTPGREYQGYAGVTHGGIVFTILDECMARLVIGNGVNAVTAKMTTRFRKPAKTGEKLAGKAHFVKKGGKFFQVASVVRNTDDEIVAEAEAVFVRMPGE